MGFFGFGKSRIEKDENIISTDEEVEEAVERQELVIVNSALGYFNEVVELCQDKAPINCSQSFHLKFMRLLKKGNNAINKLKKRQNAVVKFARKVPQKLNSIIKSTGTPQAQTLQTDAKSILYLSLDIENKIIKARRKHNTDAYSGMSWCSRDDPPVCRDGFETLKVTILNLQKIKGELVMLFNQQKKFDEDFKNAGLSQS